MRAVTNTTGASETLPVDPYTVAPAVPACPADSAGDRPNLRCDRRIGNPYAGLVGMSLSKDGQIMYAASTAENKVMSFDLSKEAIDKNSFPMTVIAGGGAASGIGADLREAVGTNAVFSQIADMAMGADGNLYVADSGFQVIRKVTPAGVVTTFSGATNDGATPPVWKKNTKVGNGDGVATVAFFTSPLKIAASPAKADGSFFFYVYDSQAIKEMSSDGTLTTKSGTVAGTDLGSNGVGTSATFDSVTDISFSVDGSVALVAENSLALPNQAGTTSSFVRKIVVDTFTVTTLAGNAAPAPAPTSGAGDEAMDAALAGDVSADGTGTSVFFSALSTIAQDSAGNAFVTEVCNSGSVVRKISPDGTVSTHSGDITAAQCKYVGKTTTVLDGSTANTFFKNGDAASSTFTYSTASVMVQRACKKFFPLGVEPDVTGCQDLGGTIQNVKTNGGSLKITTPLVVKGVMEIGAGSNVVVDAPVTLQGPLTVTGDGTLQLNGNDFVAPTITLSNDGTYQVLVNKATPGIAKAQGLATVGGCIVVAVAADYDFNVGDSVSVLQFANSEGVFNSDCIYLIKYRARSSSPTPRALLQNAATGTNVACAGTSCSATGVLASSGADDDDEIPIIVALIVVSALLFLAIVAGVYFAAAGGLPSSRNKDRTPAAAATAYGGDSTDSTSSSSYSSFAY